MMLRIKYDFMIMFIGSFPYSNSKKKAYTII